MTALRDRLITNSFSQQEQQQATKNDVNKDPSSAPTTRCPSGVPTKSPSTSTLIRSSTSVAGLMRGSDTNGGYEHDLLIGSDEAIESPQCPPRRLDVARFGTGENVLADYNRSGNASHGDVFLFNFQRLTIGEDEQSSGEATGLCTVSDHITLKPSPHSVRKCSICLTENRWFKVFIRK